MNHSEKKAWLKYNGILDTGQSIDITNKYACWISNNDEYFITRYAPSIEGALDLVYDNVKSEIYRLCVELE